MFKENRKRRRSNTFCEDDGDDEYLYCDKSDHSPNEITTKVDSTDLAKTKSTPIYTPRYEV